MKKTLQEVSKETLALERVLTSALGKRFTYTELEYITGVKMDEKGKAHMRSALKRLKLPYEVERGNGIRILSAQNATKIIVHKVVKIDNSIKRAEKTTKQVQNNVFDQLTEPEQKNILFLGSLFGTIRSYSNNAKRIFNKPVVKIGEQV